MQNLRRVRFGRLLLGFGVVVAGITLATGSTVTALGGSISGTVTGAGAGPLQGVSVLAVVNSMAVSFGVTGADGSYTIANLPPGTASVSFNPAPPFLRESVGNVPVVDGQNTAGIDAELEVGGSLSGSVVTDSGGPLGSVRVEACSTDVSFSCFLATTAADGTYSIGRLRAGNYFIEFTPPSGYFGEFYDNASTQVQATAVAVVAGLDTSPIDAALTADVCADPTSAFADSTLVSGYEWIACPSSVANQVLGSSPTPLITFDDDGGLLMTTGRAADALGPNDANDTTTSFLAPPFRTAYDVSLLRLDLDIPVGAQCLSFDFVFGSEQSPEYAGSSFNDSFIAEVGESTWAIDDGTITAPLNFAFDGSGKAVSESSTFFNSVIVDAGWEYDRTTPKLVASTPIAPGPTSIFLTIFDAGGNGWDSAVAIDALRTSPAVCTAEATSGDVWPDFDGDGLADRSVFRSEYGGWFAKGQPTAFLGLADDIPVPGDYNGDGTTDRAVYRNGAWFIEGETTRFLGTATDVPVPGDYDGDGEWEPAVFRDGAWFIDGQATSYLGAVGDVPVPGDYNGDGTTEIAVYRPSVGGWYVDGVAAVFYGLSTDVPVPGDYDGNGATDRAVYRPEFGGWYVDGLATEFLGLSADKPVPADYDGDGAVERAVFRTSVGGWYVQDAATAFYGRGTDVPLPLPAAILGAYAATWPPDPLTVLDTCSGAPATGWYQLVSTSSTTIDVYDGGLGVLGGKPPYVFDADGLDGYTLSPAGLFTHVNAPEGTETFTLRISDADAQSVELAGTIVRTSGPILPATC